MPSPASKSQAALNRRDATLTATCGPAICPQSMRPPGTENFVKYIDAFNHFFPQRFFAGVLETPARK
jgi:hypothetical protein